MWCLEHLVQPHHSGAAPGVVHGRHLVHYLPARVHAQARLAAELGGEMVPGTQLQTLVDAGPLTPAGHRHNGGQPYVQTVSILQCFLTPVMVKWFIADRGTVVYMGVVSRRGAQRIAASPPFLLNIHCGYARYMERNDLKVPPSSPDQRRTRGRRRRSW